MTEFLNSSESGAAPSLEAGLAALKRQEFREAIAHLAPLAKNHPDKNSQMKARMGLVIAYEQGGQVERAIALCQQFRSSSSRSLRQWATQTLDDLSRRHPGISIPERGEKSPAPVEGSAAALESGAIAPTSAPVAAEAALVPVPPELWPQTERATRWTPLKPRDRSLLWGVSALSVVALVVILNGILAAFKSVINSILFNVTFPIDLRSFYITDDWLVFAVLIGLVSLATLPWLMPLVLRRAYRMQPFNLDALSRYSSEASELLQTRFQQRQQPLPQLGLLPTSTPIIFSYGLLPQKTGLVLSQGLLQQLTEDEIAAIVAAEVGHIEHLDAIALSLIILVAQFPYQGYLRLSRWGDTLQGNPSAQQRQDRASQSIAVLLGGLCYGIYRLCRVAGLGLSRLRVYYGDRTAANLTGNPNALSRALMKITIGMARDIETRKQTDPLLESFDLLLPVGPRTALTLGSVYPQTPQLDLFNWDLQNPYRHWFALNNSHPLMGDRLAHLTAYARHWQLPPQLNFPARSPSPPSSFFLPPSFTPSFLRHLTPYLGLLCGWLVALLLQSIGSLAFTMNWLELSWMYQDDSILWGLLAIGLGTGILLRINTLFPDLKPETIRVNPDLADLLLSTTLLPGDGQPVELHGTLLGRRGLSNRLSQDLLLRSETGSIRLHYVPKLGPLVSLIAEISQPVFLLQRPVIVRGWFRRGATPWVDVETIQPQTGKGSIVGGHPIWSTLLALLPILWGTTTLITGRL